VKIHSGYIQKKGIILAFIIFSGYLSPLYSQGRFSFEFLPGGAVIFPSTLFISQEGYSDLKFKARYRTESFNLPIYYSFRLGYNISDQSTIELEMNHLKVKLDHNPPEIEVFTISHGFNQLLVNYAVIYKGFVFRAGVGPVIAHPESIVRGKRFETVQGFLNKGYYVNGITSQLSVQKKLFIGKHLFFSAETKFNAAYSQVKIADGFARVPLFAWHGLIGTGINF
jgi:hypothetical protein